MRGRRQQTRRKGWGGARREKEVRSEGRKDRNRNMKEGDRIQGEEMLHPPPRKGTIVCSANTGHASTPRYHSNRSTYIPTMFT